MRYEPSGRPSSPQSAAAVGTVLVSGTEERVVVAGMVVVGTRGSVEGLVRVVKVDSAGMVGRGGAGP